MQKVSFLPCPIKCIISAFKRITAWKNVTTTCFYRLYQIISDKQRIKVWNTRWIILNYSRVLFLTIHRFSIVSSSVLKVWKFSNFTATLILHEINCGRFQKFKICQFDCFSSCELWIFRSFDIFNVKFAKIKI